MKNLPWHENRRSLVDEAAASERHASSDITSSKMQLQDTLRAVALDPGFGARLRQMTSVLRER